MLGTRRGKRALIVIAGTVIGAAVFASPAAATFHLMQVREVYPGGVTNDSYLELQMVAPAQTYLTAHQVSIYDNSANLIHRETLDGDVSFGDNNSTVLIGDTNVESNFSGEAPDFLVPELNIPPGGGAACFDDAEPVDCVAWGNFTGTVPLTGALVGSPASPVGGVTAGKALRRKITANCPTFLDGPDDTDSSFNDFEEVTPNPRNNGSPVIETPCPDTFIGPAVNDKPRNPTNSTSATFSNFTSSLPGSTFECKLDNGSFAACDPTNINPDPPPPATYGPLSEGSHTFQVKAIKNGVEDLSPASYTWTVDLTRPNTTGLTPNPSANPTTSSTMAFTFGSTEANSTFTCQLDSGAAGACVSGKSYSGLTTSGQHTFTVFATDQAGNADLSPASYTWTVDRTPPNTTITAQPDNPSASSTPTFMYESDEPFSTFRCKLDSAPAENCNPPPNTQGTVSYGAQNDGPHTFKVWAVDPLGNDETEASADTYTWTIDANSDPPPNTIITKAPKRRGTKRVVKVEFTANPATGATFTCQIDARPVVNNCTSPFTTPRLKYGKHTITVIATGPGGPDLTPAEPNFKIIRP